VPGSLPGAASRLLNRTFVGRPYVVSERARALHASLVVADLHADPLIWGRDLLRRSSSGHVDVPRLIEGNVALQVLAVGTHVPLLPNLVLNPAVGDAMTFVTMAGRWPRRTWTSRLERAVFLAARANVMATASAGRLTLIRTVGDLERYLAAQRSPPAVTAAVLAIEGAQALDGDVAKVDVLARAGYRMVGLTHFVDNAFAGSAHGLRKIGLTRRGRELVRRLEARSVLVDVAHASRRTIDDVVAVAARPVIASHTGVVGTCPSIRNLADDQLLAIAATGGLVGVGFWPTATCGRDPAAIARAIAHAVSVVGSDHVALGSDFDGAVPVPFDASGMALLTEALLAIGLCDTVIGRVMGGNVIELLSRTLPSDEEDG